MARGGGEKRTGQRDADPPRHCIDLAYAREGNVFVFGWLLEGPARITGAALEIGTVRVDVTAQILRHPRADVLATLGAEASAGPAECGLLLAARIDPRRQDARRLVLHIARAAGPPLRLEAPLAADLAQLADFAARHAEPLRALLARLEPAMAAPLAAEAFGGHGQRLLVDQPHGIERRLRFSLDIAVRALPERLVIAGAIDDPAGAVSTIEVRTGAGDAPLRARLRRGPVLRAGEPDGGCDRFVLVAECPAAGAEGFVLMVAGSGRACECPIAAPGEGIAALAAATAALDADSRLLLLESLAESGAEALATGEQAAALRRLWQVAVAALPSALDRPERDLRISLDPALAIDGAGVLIQGWAALDRAPLDSLALRQTGTAEPLAELLGVAFRYPDPRAGAALAGAWRGDDEQGCLAFVRAPPAAPGALYLAVSDGARRIAHARVPCAATPGDPRRAAEALLARMPASRRAVRAGLDAHLGPALASVWPGRAASVQPIVTAFGPTTEQAVSVVVPFLGAPDGLAPFLAACAADPDLAGADLVLAVDDPELHEAAFGLCHARVPDLGLQLRLAYGLRPLGRAGVINLGAGLARGRLLLMLEPGLAATAPGWLGRLIAAHGRAPRPGAVGPVLLAADGAAARAGLRFSRAGRWGGLFTAASAPMEAADAAGGDEPRPVPALGLACLLVERAMFEAQGGLSRDYLGDDYAGADFCLRLAQAQAGRHSLVVPSVQLHLAPSEPPDEPESPRAVYDAWLLTGRFGEMLEKAAAPAGQALP